MVKAMIRRKPAQQPARVDRVIGSSGDRVIGEAAISL